MDESLGRGDGPPLKTTRRAARWAPLAIILIVGFALRIYWLPDRYEQRNIDEPAYLSSSLLLLEGVTPGHHAVPGGLQFWRQWARAGAQAAWNLVRPTAEELQLRPRKVRPVYALDRAIFDHYRDLSNLRNFTLWCNVAYGLLAIVAAWKFGEQTGGFPGALVCAGMFAVLPVFLDVAGTSRPHIAALAMVVLCALAAVRSKGLERVWPAAIFFGLAAGTRIEMLTLFPLIAAIVIADAGWARGIKRLALFGLYSLVSFMVIAPWWMMTFFGNVRSIIGARFKVGMVAGVSTSQLLYEFMIVNALLLPTVLLFMTWRRAATGPRGWVVPAAATLIFATMLAGGNNFIQYQLAPVITVVLVAAMGVKAVPARLTKPLLAMVMVSMVVAAGWSVRRANLYKAMYVADEATDWLEAHVPPGTRVYWPHGLGKLPLPTESAAAAMWDEVTNDEAWRRKIAWGLLTPNDWKRPLPRATSDEILLKERANVRLWFILGGRPEVKAPRFDVRQFVSSITFGVLDPISEFQKTGGVLVWRGEKPTQLGEPVKSWTIEPTRGTFIFVSPDLEPNLLPYPVGGNR